LAIVSRRQKIPEVSMAQTIYKISDAPKTFATALERANRGEEIIILRGNEICARIGPADGGKRPYSLLRQRGLPDDLFDEFDPEQAAIDAGDWMTTSVSGGAGQPTASPKHEGFARQPRRLVVDNRQRPVVLDGPVADRGQGQQHPR
jgi:antitoxin (DNA-binding transcriptional repressor) of toxin-antitoxin stability system